MFLQCLGNRRHHRHQNPTWLHESKRPLLRISSDCIKDNVHSIQRVLESRFFIVHNSFSTQASDIIQVSGCGGSNYMEASLAGQLYKVRANITCCTVNEYSLPGGCMG